MSRNEGLKRICRNKGLKSGLVIIMGLKSWLVEIKDWDQDYGLNDWDED